MVKNLNIDWAKHFYDSSRESYKLFLYQELKENCPLSLKKAGELVEKLKDKEAQLARDLSTKLIKEEGKIIFHPAFSTQKGLNCTTYSFVNGIIYLQEPYFYGKTQKDVDKFVNHIVEKTPGEDRGKETRSISAMSDYLKTGDHKTQGLKRDYTLTPTNSLLNIVYHLAEGPQRGVVLVGKNGHAELAYALSDKKSPKISIKDPMHSGTKEIPLEKFASEYVEHPAQGIKANLNRKGKIVMMSYEQAKDALTHLMNPNIDRCKIAILKKI